MRKKFVIFGYEICIRPESDIKYHYTNFPEVEYGAEKVWEHNFPIQKRIDVYTQFKGFIEYVFSRYDAALLNYGESAIYHLEVILKSFREIREKFEARGASKEQLESFDEKIYKCFDKTIYIAEEKLTELMKSNSEDLQYQEEIMKKLRSFNIKYYYNEFDKKT